MTPQNKRFLWIFLALCALAFFLRRRPSAGIIGQPDGAQYVRFNPETGDSETINVSGPAINQAFYAPFFWPTPGVSPDLTIPFESTINIQMGNPALAGLSNQYIPLYGFVGMTAVGS